MTTTTGLRAPAWVPEACQGCDKLKMAREPNGVRVWRCGQERRTLDPFGDNAWACEKTPESKNRRGRFNEIP